MLILSSNLYAIKLNNECACKFITLDAYKESALFYEKWDSHIFQILTWAKISGK